MHVAREAPLDRERENRPRRIPRVTRAVEEERLRLLAQAIVPLAPGRVARPRCEILLRLADERGGLDTAESLFADAERLGLIPELDRWVVHRAVSLVSAWRREHPECELPLCSINLSVRSLDDPDLVADVGAQLAQYGLPPAAIAFEIDEAAALANFAQLVRFISEIRALGCGFGLDDFGGGLASFVHLKALSVDYVKIGAHYVRSVAEDPVYGTLVSAVGEIGRILGIATIAEGVESEDHLQKLRDLGAEYAQGNAMAPPMHLLDEDGSVVLPCVQRVS